MASCVARLEPSGRDEADAETPHFTGRIAPGRLVVTSSVGRNVRSAGEIAVNLHSLTIRACSTKMRYRFLLIAALFAGCLPGCAVVSVAGAAVGVAGTVVSTGVSVAGTVVSTTASVAGSAVQAVIP